MNRARFILPLLLGIALIAGAVAPAEGQGGQGMPVSGIVINRAGIPMAGLTVQLLHPQSGPSFPTVTNPSGYYFFANVPTKVTTPYVIEVRWGRQTVFRDYLRHLGQQEPIRLR